MGTAVISRWARRYLLVGAGFLVASQAAALAGYPRRVEVLLGLLGFVVTVAFGKAYSLIPSYFDRTLAVPVAPAVHLPLAIGGVVGLAAATLETSPTWVGRIGGSLWALGVLVFLGTLAATLRDNPIGSETGTSDVNARRQRLDRVANGFMPLALAYLALGSWELVAPRFAAPTVFDGYVPRSVHLLAAGFALLLVFSVGFRLLPRFLSADPPTWLAYVVLPTGALGPILLARGIPAGPLFQAGALLVSIAVVGFALAFVSLFWRSDRQRVGFYGPLLGVVAGVVGVGLGLSFAFGPRSGASVLAHLRLNVFGLLGLTIVGVIYQFYPPAVGQWPLAGDRLAGGTLAGMASGVGLAALGPLVDPGVATVGHLLVAVAGSALGYLLLSAIRAQTAR